MHDESSTYKIFGGLLEYEKTNTHEMTPNRSGSKKKKRTSEKKHRSSEKKRRSSEKKRRSSAKKKKVKFMEFTADSNKKPKRKMEESVFLPSKHTILTTSPNDDNESIRGSYIDLEKNQQFHTTIDPELFTPISMRMTPSSKIEQDVEIEVQEQDATLAEEKRQLRLRSTPITTTIRKLENEKDVKKNLNAITQEFAQSVEDYQNDTSEILQKLDLFEQKQSNLKDECDKYKATFIGLSSSDQVSSETRKLYDEINYENELDMKDFNEINHHKSKELEKLERELSEAQNDNRRLRAKIELNNPDDSHALKKKIDKLVRSNEKKVKPLVEENEDLVDQLQRCQNSRRKMIESLIEQNNLPKEYEDLVRDLNEETEASIFLQKGKEEQKITLDAFKKVYNSQQTYYKGIDKIYRTHTKVLQKAIEEINSEKEEYDKECTNADREIETINDTLREFKENMPSFQQTQPKFDDKYEMEGITQRLQTLVGKEMKLQSDVGKGPAAIHVNFKFDSALPKELVQITEEVSDVGSAIDAQKLECQRLFRDRALLDKKHSLFQNQQSDIGTIHTLTQNLDQNNIFADEELNSLKIAIESKKKQVTNQDEKIHDLHKKILELKQNLARLENIDNSETENEIYRLRKIIDGLNHQIEKLRFTVSRDDEHYTVSAKILVDKDKIIRELRTQLRSMQSISPRRSKERHSTTQLSSTRSKKKTNFFTYSASSSITHSNKRFSGVKKKIHKASLHRVAHKPKSASLIDSLLQDYLRENE